MTGPVAPRDPEKARAYFYIMRGKEICGLKQGDGKAVQFIYESDGRLENSAQIVGNITDSRILELLGTVKGFRTLVHSIGVSVEMEHPAEKIEFVFNKEDVSIGEYEKIDYKNINKINGVEATAIIGKVIKGEDSKFGINVFGQEVKPKKIKEK